VELAAKKSPAQHEVSCGLAVVLPDGRQTKFIPTLIQILRATGECTGAGVRRVWIGSSHTDLSGSPVTDRRKGFEGLFWSGTECRASR